MTGLGGHGRQEPTPPPPAVVTVDQAMNYRNALESQILDLLREYSNKTGLHVERIELLHERFVGTGNPGLVNVAIDVRMRNT